MTEVSAEQNADVLPSQSEEIKEQSKTLGEGAFSGISRKITDKDLKNPTIARLLLDDRDRLLKEKVILESFRDNYYTADKRAAILEEKENARTKFEALYSFVLSVGGLFLGLAASISSLTFRIIDIILGIVLWGAAVYLSQKK